MSPEIHYPDGGVGIVKDKTFEVMKNSPIAVINPKASSKHTFIVSADGRPIQFTAGMVVMSDVPLIEKPNVEQSDPEGKRVKSVTYIKTTGELLPSG